MTRYVFDIDGTICTQSHADYEHEVKSTNHPYDKAKPWKDRIKKINMLYDNGDHITYMTARAMGRFSGDSERAIKEFETFTRKQLKSWGCKFHKLILGKPHADKFIDDKGINSEDFFSWLPDKDTKYDGDHND